MKLAMLKGGLETGDELAAKDPPQHLDGEKEARPGSNPAGAVEREPPGGDDTVDMGMKLEFLVPSVEHAEEANLGPECLGLRATWRRVSALARSSKP